ncbi:MAG: sialate O-acetylesterase [Bacteroidota bacterium]
MISKSVFSSLLLMVSSFSTVLATISLPAVYGDHMVLQQQEEVLLWGWGSPLEQLSVIGSWDGKVHRDTTDNHANWHVTLQTPKAGGPYTITIIGSNTLVLEDVMIGEVWLCSGQSNMEWSVMHGIQNGTQEAFEANHPGIRLFHVEKRSADVPQLDVVGKWASCTPESMAGFSAVAYFFGRNLQQDLKIPIGLIHSSWGGTPAEAWINQEVLARNERLAKAAEKIKPMPWCPNRPGTTYNAMLAPLIPFPIAGAIWYQGETNTANHESYQELFSAMIDNWRSEWQRDFPFYYVQIAPFRYGQKEVGVAIREAQRKTLATSKTGMVVISDIGNIKDIHPRNKQDVGKRLAAWALSNTYQKEGIVYSGPLYQKMEREGNKIRVYFDHAEGGLVSRNGTLTHFEIAGEDGTFVPAKAEIDGATILVQAGEIRRPQAVRFAWDNVAEPNLFNQAGLPASSFRSDNP